MAKKKRAVRKTASAPTKQTPAMYPTPEPVELATPQKIIDIDLKTKTITIEGSPPPEMTRLGELEDWRGKVVAHDPKTNKVQLVFSLPPEKEKRRLNLTERLKHYAKKCAIQISPHWGERPKHISPAKWRNLDQRIKAMDELPENAPAEARDALMALHTLNRMVKELVEAGDWPEAIDRAICEAIDFGQLLQRGQTQIDHGGAVDRGTRNAKAVAGATEAKRTKKIDRSEPAHAEFNRRMATVKNSRMKFATLENMSKMKDISGNQIWKIGTLIRWSRDWN